LPHKTCDEGEIGSQHHLQVDTVDRLFAVLKDVHVVKIQPYAALAQPPCAVCGVVTGDCSHAQRKRQD
jgi:hypothetical protein